MSLSHPLYVFKWAVEMNIFYISVTPLLLFFIVVVLFFFFNESPVEAYELSSVWLISVEGFGEGEGGGGWDVGFFFYFERFFSFFFF